MNTVQGYVEKVLQPKLQGDGGWIEFVSLENGVLTVSKLAGAAPQLWSLNINFITTKDLSIN